VAETAAAVDPRLVALGLTDEIAVEFPEGTVDVDATEAAPVVPPPEPEPLPPSPSPLPRAPLALRAEPSPVAEPLPESATLIETSVVHGAWPRAAELTIEELGFRVNGRSRVAVRWSDVTSIDVRRGRVNVRAGTATVPLALAVEGVAAPELNAEFARVLSDARDGTLDVQGTAVHELQNAMDSVRDTFEASDDPFIPRALGGALAMLTLILALALPEILSFLTRPAVTANAFVLGSRLQAFDPRVLLVAVAAAALVTSLAARAALGPHAMSWARGTLRGWHIERPSPVAHIRKGVAVVFLYPAAAAALLAAALLIALPSARSHATVDPARIHVVRPLPFFDRTASWSDVVEIVPLAATGAEHPHGLAVLIRFTDGASVTTQDLPVRNSTDRYFLELTRKWSARR
jgi:hypothetical protein